MAAAPGRVAIGPVMVGRLLALCASITLAVSVGSLSILPLTVWRIVVHHLTGLGDAARWTELQDNLVWELRLPRALLAAVIGAGLSVVGVAVQALVRNPLAGPLPAGNFLRRLGWRRAVHHCRVSLFGVSSTPAAAFLGAMASFLLVYAFARRGRTLAPLRLILAGVAIGYALSWITSFLVLQASNPAETQSVLFWLLGSLSQAQWS